MEIICILFRILVAWVYIHLLKFVGLNTVHITLCKFLSQLQITLLHQYASYQIIVFELQFHPSIVNFVILKPTWLHFFLLCQVAPCSTLPIEGDRGGLGVWRKKKEIILASFCSFPVSCLCIVFVHHSSHIFTHIAEYPTHNSSRIQCAVFQPLQNLPYQHSQEIPAPGWHLLFRVLGPRPTGPLLYDQRH